MVGKKVVLSYGMGTESTAILLRWLLDPSSRDFDLSDLIVITSQTGDEYADTKRLVETYMFPLMRKRGIRFVEVARAGHLEEDGIVLLQDTKKPTELHTEGAYKLSQELMTAGMVPAFGGEHKCSMKFKAFVIESWMEENVYGPIRHAFGYNADETERVEKSEKAFKDRAAKLAFGFNSDETDRVEKARKYDTEVRVGIYPLLEWGWNREACEQYIQKELNVLWRKSACVYCPFNALKADGIERLREHSSQAADALMLEFVSLCMNFRGTLYSTSPLYNIVKKNKIDAAVREFENKLASTPWGIYRVRRIYSKKGSAERCVEKLEEGSRDSIESKLVKAAMAHALEIKVHEKLVMHGITYMYLRKRTPDVYPAIEEFYVAAPAVVENKARYGIPRFDERWKEFLRTGKIPEPKSKLRLKRLSSQVKDVAEMERIWKAHKKNGGTLSYVGIENEKSFRLKWANGMTAWRICEKYEEKYLNQKVAS